ncbi:MAG: hypothetical protein ACT4OP_07345, partial [Actinomycetota bacterium]
GIVRLAAAVVAVSISSTAAVLGWAMVCAPLGTLLVRPWRFDNATVEGVVATPARGFLVNYALGSSASQLLLAGAPLGIAALGGTDQLRSVMFVTFTLYRAPLTLIYNLQGRVLSLLVRLGDKDNLARLAKRVGMGGLVLIAMAALVGWMLGAQVVGVLFGEEFMPVRLVAALAAAGVIAASVTQVLSQALVAGGSTGELAGAWVGGLTAGLVTMAMVGGPPEIRVASGFLVGELVALALAGWRTARAR